MLTKPHVMGPETAEIVGKAENFNKRLPMRLALVRVAARAIGSERLQAGLVEPPLHVAP